MNKINIILSVACFSLFGCQTTDTYIPDTKGQTNNQIQGCGYDQVNSPEFVLTKLQSKYVINAINRSPSSRNPDALNSNIEPYIYFANGGKFKFLGEQYEGNKYSKGKNSIIQIEGNPYKYDQGYFTSIVTPDCKKLYYTGSFIEESVIPADNLPWELSDYEAVFKAYNLREHFVPKAKVVKDKFSKIIRITGLKHGAVLFRSSILMKSPKVTTVQLYAIVAGTGGWHFIDRAYDEDGTKYDITKITTETDCSNSFLGCITKEHIGINIPVDYLKTKFESGFEVKYAGTREKVLKVQGWQVKQIFDAVKPYI